MCVCFLNGSRAMDTSRDASEALPNDIVSKLNEARASAEMIQSFAVLILAL